MPDLTTLEFVVLAVVGFGALCSCALCIFTLAIDPVEDIDEERL